ncbi:hypothetical protein [Sporosarcina koreensis]|uniref:hypothetical protein n=1 Tax=Bacillales TaxID=1385 RepID=UPI000753700E|nr:hypothetical protein [Sporosarcina koreensis]
MEWTALLVALIAFFGVLIGHFSTYFTQKNTVSKQINNEIRRDNKAENIERLLVYNGVLKLEGEVQMLTDAGEYALFDLESYREKFRPILYSKFHLLDQDVSIYVRGIDVVITSPDIFGEIGRKNNDKLIELFSNMIVNIELHIDNYRNSNSQ